MDSENVELSGTFLNLPPEILGQIFALVFPFDEVIKMKNPSIFRYRHSSITRVRYSFDIQILLVSRHFYTEGRPYFYSKNLFEFRDVPALSQWMSTTDNLYTYIRSLKLDFLPVLQAPKVFSALATANNLRSLVLNFPDPTAGREVFDKTWDCMEIADHFVEKRETLKALGMAELMSMRGLQSVQIAGFEPYTRKTDPSAHVPVEEMLAPLLTKRLLCRKNSYTLAGDLLRLIVNASDRSEDDPDHAEEETS